MSIEANSKFFVTGIDTLRDPVRNTRWRVQIPGPIFTAVASFNPSDNLNKFANDLAGDTFALHVKDCKLPTIESTTKELWYMGYAQQHVVQQKVYGEMDFTTILLEDMAAYEAILTWNQTTLNSGILYNNNVVDNNVISRFGLSRGLGIQKDIDNTTISQVLRNQTIKVELYNWQNGSIIYTLNLINAMPTRVGDIGDLKYGPDADILNFKFKLKYDRWTVTIPQEYDNKSIIQA